MVKINSPIYLNQTFVTTYIFRRQNYFLSSKCMYLHAPTCYLAWTLLSLFFLSHNNKIRTSCLLPTRVLHMYHREQEENQSRVKKNPKLKSDREGNKGYKNRIICTTHNSSPDYNAITNDYIILVQETTMRTTMDWLSRLNPSISNLEKKIEGEEECCRFNNKTTIKKSIVFYKRVDIQKTLLLFLTFLHNGQILRFKDCFSPCFPTMLHYFAILLHDYSLIISTYVRTYVYHYHHFESRCEKPIEM